MFLTLLVIVLLLWLILSVMAHSEIVQDYVLVPATYDKVPLAKVPKKPLDTLIVYFRGNLESQVVFDTDLPIVIGPAVQGDLRKTLEVAEAFFLEVVAHRPKNLIVYGRSLGGYVAAHVASRHRVDALLLETPLVSLEEAMSYVTRGFSKYVVGRPGRGRVEIIPLLKSVNCPVSVAIAANDEIIPASDALKEFPHKIFNCTHNEVRTQQDWAKWFADAIAFTQSST